MVLNVSCELIHSISLNILAFISFFLFSGLRYALGNNVFKFQVYTCDNWLTKTFIKLKSHTSVNQTHISIWKFTRHKYNEKYPLTTSVEILQFWWNFEYAFDLWSSLRLSNLASNAFLIFQLAGGENPHHHPTPLHTDH